MTHPLRFAIALTVFTAIGASGGTLLTGTAAKLGDKIVTVRDVAYFAALHRLKERKEKGWTDPFAALPADELKRYTKRVLLEEMVLAEIKSLEFLGPKKSEANALVAAQRGKAKAQWSEFLRYYGKSDDQAAETLFRSLTVDEFLEKKMETLTPLISEEEITSYLNQSGNKAQAGETETVRQSVARLLRQEKMQKGLENWLAALQEKYLAVSLLP